MEVPKLVQPGQRSFTTISEDLNKALADVNSKKVLFDNATAAVQKASGEYQKSVEHARYLRAELDKSLNDSMGEVDTHVRQSA